MAAVNGIAANSHNIQQRMATTKVRSPATVL